MTIYVTARQRRSHYRYSYEGGKHPSKERRPAEIILQKGVTTQFWEPILTLPNMIAVHESSIRCNRRVGRQAMCALPLSCNQVA